MLSIYNSINDKMKKRFIVFISALLIFFAVLFSAFEILSEGGRKPFFYFNSYTVKNAEVCGPYGSCGAKLTSSETEELCSILRELRIGRKADILISLQTICDGGSDQYYRITLFNGRVISIGARSENSITIDFEDYEENDKSKELYNKLFAFRESARISHQDEIEKNSKYKGAVS